MLSHSEKVSSGKELPRPAYFCGRGSGNFSWRPIVIKAWIFFLTLLQRTEAGIGASVTGMGKPLKYRLAMPPTPRTTASHLQLWAKSPPNGEGDGYPLLPHLLDVAAVASQLQQTIPCPVPLPCSPAWVSALVGFHDLGKATPGFQQKLGRRCVSGFPRFPAGAPDRHDASTLPLLVKQLEERLGLPGRDAKHFAAAVAAHHGHPINAVGASDACRSAKHLEAPWHEAHKQLFNDVLEGVGTNELPELPPKGAQRAAFLQWLMGLTTVSDWIGSSEDVCRWDRLEGWGDNPVKWFTESQQLAVAALSAVGLDPAALRTTACGEDAIAMALGGMNPRPLQQTMAHVVEELKGCRGPGLVVVEAPMGEGKTEAGFGCAVGRRGLYVAMPSQATSNALMGRTAQFLERAHHSAKLALAHGAGGPAIAARRLHEVGLGTADSAVKAGWWFHGSKRSLLCPQGIGTVDQALIGVLNARHGFVRLFGLTGRTVILDEVHAYDAYTGGLIERLVSWLQQLGCRVVLMSATLPSKRRNGILRAWAEKEDDRVPSGPYPRISWASPGSIQSLSFPASRHQRLLVRGIDPDEVATRAITMAKAGARVLLVVNTVARAQTLYRAITGVERTLFHARFPMNQRIEIENKVLRQFGPAGETSAGHVLVATQVAEQSLDIDMDVLITDPAPVDLVLQRAGRIHRHDRQRPNGFQDSVVLVAGLDQEVSPAALSTIYDRWLVLRSHAWLKKHPKLELPEDIDLAVQQVYGDWEPPAPERELEDALAGALPEHEKDEKRMGDQSRQAGLPEPRNWTINDQKTQLIDDDEAESGAIPFGTRLGQPSLTVIPVFPADCECLAERTPDLAGRWLRISHQGLIRAIHNVQPPAKWSTCSGLGHHKALLLDADGVFRDQNRQRMACLDRELGLVID